MKKTLGKCDLFIKGGDFLDGTGRPSMKADVAINGDRVVAIGIVNVENPEQTIDATNHMIAPGFIDVHTHDDRLLLSNPEVTPKLSQGVTTVVVGNCGASLSPWLSNFPPPPPLDLIIPSDNESYRFPTFSSYSEALEKHPAAINSFSLIGHSTLRCCAMKDIDRPASEPEIKIMKEHLRNSLQEGAGGFSTGLFYQPNKPAPPSEVEALASELKPFRGVYATHMRNEADQLLESLDETFETAKRAGCPVVISHHKCQGSGNWGRSIDSLARIEKANEQQEVSFDVYPYVAGSTVLLEEMISSSFRIIITWSKAFPEAGGKDLSEIAKEWNCSVEEAMSRLQPGGGIYFSMKNEDVERILSHPMAMIGSDGIPHDVHPHPRLWGTFPRVLGHFVRERKLFNLAKAVNKMTGIPATNFKLHDRGILKEGSFADVVIFNPKTIRDCATFEKPIQKAFGIHTVIVNGAIAWVNGEGTGSRTGCLLKNPVCN